jgi:hypothetical protein
MAVITPKHLAMLQIIDDPNAPLPKGISEQEAFELQNELIDMDLVEIGFMAEGGDYAILMPTVDGKRALLV